MSTASLALGVSVGGAFALLIIVLVVAYCIYLHKHPDKRNGMTAKVRPDSIAGIKEQPEHLTTKYGNRTFCFCCIESPSESVPPPDPPIKLELKDLQSNDVTICWKPPAAFAASRIDNYVIYLRPSDKPDDWTRIAKVKNNISQHLVQQLESDKRYVLGVASRNKGGVSSIIETKPFILKNTTAVPGKPTSVTVTDVQKDRLTLQWQPPKTDGNSRIEYYHVIINDGGTNWNHYSKEAAFVGLNKCFIENLHKNTPYRFRLCAENAIGFGPCAETKGAAFVKKDLGPPLKPLGPVRYNKTTHKSVTLSWKQRTLDTFPVSRYIIEMLDPRTEKWRQVGETAENVTTYCVPKLPEDTELKFRVIAVNDAGKSVPLIGKKMRTALRGTSEYGSSRSAKSAYSGSTSSNTKLTKSALQRVLAHWEASDQQVPPRTTNPGKLAAHDK